MSQYKLDFSHSNCRTELEKLLEVTTKESVHYSTFQFCLDWINEEEYFQFSTSGSTGVPQLQMVSRKRIVASVEATASYFGLKTEDKALVCMNTKYTGGKMMLARALHLGMVTFIIEPSNNALSILENEAFDLIAAVPSQVITFLKDQNSDILSRNCKHLLIGGVSVSEELKLKLKDLNGISIYETFGMTETLSHIALKKLNQNDRNVFETLPSVQIKTNIDDCLLIKAEVTNNEWIETKDIVEIVDTTHFRWKGRRDNVINSGGIKIYPEEIEELLIPVLLESEYKGPFFLFGLHDNKLGQKVVLVLEGSNLDEKSLIDKMKSKLPKFHSPIGIVNMDQFFRTQSGKIIRKIEV